MPENEKSVKPAHSAGKATLIVMFALILSKLTGQVREMLIPGQIGFGMLSDAYILGFLVPDLIYQLLIGGSIQAAVTPTLSGAIFNKREKNAWKSVSIFINITAIVMLFAVLIGELLIPFLLPMFSGDKSEETVALAASVSRMLFPQVFFMMLAALSIGVLNAYKKFTASSLGPIIYNICVIISMIIFGNRTADGVVKVAAGVLISACIYFFIQFYSSREQFKLYKFSFDYKDAGFQRIVRLAVPTLLSASIVQLNLIILSAFTNFYSDGSLTSLRFAITTWQLPYGVFAVAVGGVMLPTLSGYFAGKDYKSCSKVITRSIRSALFLIIPSSIIFAILSREVIRGIFWWGRSYLTADNIDLTAKMLMWYCIAMVCHSVIYILNMAFYAMGRTKIPLMNGLLTLVTNTLFCLVFTKFTGLGVVSMPAAFSLSSIISVVLLGCLLHKNNRECAPRKIPQYLLKALICAGVSAIALYFVQRTGWDSPVKITQLVILGIKSAIGMCVYFSVALLLQMKEPIYVLDKMKRPFRSK